MKLKFAIIAVGLASFATTHGASHFQLDFSTVAGSQAGWETINGTGSPNGSYSGYTDLAAGNLTVSLSNISFNRQYGNSGSNQIDFPGTTLDAMYSDLMFRNNASLPVNVTIGGLLAGTYQITIHNMIATNNPGEFSLMKTDSTGASNIGNFATGTGDGSSFNPTVITFEAVSNGTGNIIVQMDQTVAVGFGNTGGWFGINGLEIEVAASPIPEPSSLALLGLGGLLFLRRKR